LLQQPSLAEAAEQLLAMWELGQSGSPENRIEPGPIEPGPIEPGPQEGALPVSSGQQRLWFVESLASGSPVYNLHFGLRMKGALNQNLLRHSLRELLDRHTILRTIFREINGEPHQWVQPSGPAEYSSLDLCAVAETEREGQLHTAATAFASELFDLAKGPLVRFQLVTMAE